MSQIAIRPQGSWAERFDLWSVGSIEDTLPYRYVVFDLSWYSRITSSSAGCGADRRRLRSSTGVGPDGFRLVPERIREMTPHEDEGLVDALADLLVVWFEQHPERLPLGGRA